LHSRVSSESENFPSKRFKVDELTAVQVWSPIVLVVLVAAVYFFNIRGLIVARDLIQALQPQAGGVNDNISYIKNALSRNTIGGQEVREQLIQLASNVINAPAASQDVKATFLSLAESEMTKQIDRQPTDARLRVFYGSFLVQAGDRENALKHFEEAYRLSPRKQTIAFGLSSFYLANGQFDKALTVMKQTFEGAPENNEARLIYAAVAIYSKNNKLVEDLLIPRYGTVAVPDQRIVQAYFDTNQFGPAETAALAMAKLQPNDTTPRLALAAIYLNSGHREKSIAELQKVVVINPSFKAQADEFIKQIRAGKTFR
jgi:tetratricopeptide (TPR) repeat protein